MKVSKKQNMNIFLVKTRKKYKKLNFIFTYHKQNLYSLRYQ